MNCSDAGEVTRLRHNQLPNRNEEHESIGLQRQTIRPQPSRHTIFNSKATVNSPMSSKTIIVKLKL